jgi:hypothetical protein
MKRRVELLAGDMVLLQYGLIIEVTVVGVALNTHGHTLSHMIVIEDILHLVGLDILRRICWLTCQEKL